ncbi:dihydrofolate reductase [Paenibacillus puerhi]|uniref:dihydrofolate reductase n=1 Tax=Paenibacillus puerhi TaxID=2692622 RepID=UPI00135692D4|nr:dihydrofolate reductase [Paenibacillus puerhi]
MTISFILAMDEARGIGYQNKLPWHLPADLQFFKRTTMGGTILMGRKTYDSIGKPLPGRTNVVLTRDEHFRAEGCQVIRSVTEAVERYGRGGEKAGEELFVIGGAEVFRLLMPYADRLYVTEIRHTFAADTFFPELEPGVWREVTREPGIRNEKNPYDYDFVLYERERGEA